MRVLVTGGAGFVGRTTVVELLRRPAVTSVEVLDDGSFGDLADLDGLPVSTREASVLDRDVVEAAMHHADAVIHLATRWADGAGVADPIGVHEVNTMSTIRLLDAAAALDLPVTICPARCPDAGPRDAVDASALAVAAALSATRHTVGVRIAEVHVPALIGPGRPVGHPRGGWVADRIRGAVREGVVPVGRVHDREVLDVRSAAAVIVDAALAGNDQRVSLGGYELRDLEIAAHVSRILGRPVAVERRSVDEGAENSWVRGAVDPSVGEALDGMIREALDAELRPASPRRA